MSRIELVIQNWLPNFDSEFRTKWALDICQQNSRRGVGNVARDRSDKWQRLLFWLILLELRAMNLVLIMIIANIVIAVMLSIQDIQLLSISSLSFDFHFQISMVQPWGRQGERDSSFQTRQWNHLHAWRTVWYDTESF